MCRLWIFNPVGDNHEEIPERVMVDDASGGEAGSSRQMRLGSAQAGSRHNSMLSAFPSGTEAGSSMQTVTVPAQGHGTGTPSRHLVYHEDTDEDRDLDKEEIEEAMEEALAELINVTKPKLRNRRNNKYFKCCFYNTKEKNWNIKQLLGHAIGFGKVSSKHDFKVTGRHRALVRYILTNSLFEKNWLGLRSTQKQSWVC